MPSLNCVNTSRLLSSHLITSTPLAVIALKYGSLILKLCHQAQLHGLPSSTRCLRRFAVNSRGVEDYGHFRSH